MTESQNSMTFDKIVMFHDFSMIIFIVQVFQSPWEPCYFPLFSETDFDQKKEKGFIMCDDLLPGGYIDHGIYCMQSSYWMRDRGKGVGSIVKPAATRP